MIQKAMNLLAKASAEFNALGDDENSGMLAGAIDWLVIANDLPDEVRDQADKVFISMRDKAITEIPDIDGPDDAKYVIEALLDGCDELLAGAKLLTACVALLKDYWAEHLRTESETFEE